jgi:hypothetical protein
MIFHDPIDVKLYDAEQTPQLMQDTWYVINNDL